MDVSFDELDSATLWLCSQSSAFLFRFGEASAEPSLVSNGLVAASVGFVSETKSLVVWDSFIFG